MLQHRADLLLQALLAYMLLGGIVTGKIKLLLV